MYEFCPHHSKGAVLISNVPTALSHGICSGRWAEEKFLVFSNLRKKRALFSLILYVFLLVAHFLWFDYDFFLWFWLWWLTLCVSLFDADIWSAYYFSYFYEGARMILPIGLMEFECLYCPLESDGSHQLVEKSTDKKIPL